ncbi:hypothetical protein BDBG_17357 [Blastomyces gilchristii SLH14081]|uniref:Uncharacterized protein n=1 Tax=Blastomyces gilchristii (strain SLH14081) TaxID=559298 RepID=A0A179UTN6_BLAGS|nr:uncharacterized protein BDBG_17357 [Blastomyces gilchristii SLH14081]OAT10427.1 hypothetical protein BDBG_17357 [Blastomyces gilchristii SLH14081]
MLWGCYGSQYPLRIERGVSLNRIGFGEKSTFKISKLRIDSSQEPALQVIKGNVFLYSISLSSSSSSSSPAAASSATRRTKRTTISAPTFKSLLHHIPAIPNLQTSLKSQCTPLPSSSPSHFSPWLALRLLKTANPA